MFHFPGDPSPRLIAILTCEELESNEHKRSVHALVYSAVGILSYELWPPRKSIRKPNSNLRNRQM